MNCSKRRGGRALRLLPWPLLLLSAVVPGAAALPTISEVFYDARGSDDGHSFVELYGEPGTDLDGFRLEGVNGAGGAVGPVLALSGVIGSAGVFVVADRRADGTTEVPGADLLLDFDLQNGPDSLVLRLGEEVVDAVGYGVFDAGLVFAGEGLPAPDAPAGSSLARVDSGRDTDRNELDFAVLAEPSPGRAQAAPVPEPASLFLGLAGLGVLAVLGRRRGASG